VRKPLSYWLFKLRLEFHHIDTFGKDDKIRKEYKKYLKEFYEQENKQTIRDETHDT
jgi:Leu/Phe-tRNA-protein transferase|tara:strand:+ start:397 stop:564 length:168 start_codon:yes stop_codon:yes gene_type:complete